jgi:SAM-dependent methyltransferase
VQNVKRDFKKREECGNFAANLRFLDEANVLKPGIKILEIGCGRGRLLNHYHRLGYQIFGIDIRESIIDESRGLYGYMPLCKMSGQALGFGNSFFDIILSFDVFEHVPDSDRHLQEVSRILKSGGYYLLQTPNKWTNAIFETIRWRSPTRWRTDHCSLHNYWEIKRRFAKNGFEVGFSDIPVVDEFYKLKIRAFLGTFGLFTLKIINPDELPIPLRSNFYVNARKRA